MDFAALRRHDHRCCQFMLTLPPSLPSPSRFMHDDRMWKAAALYCTQALPVRMSSIKGKIGQRKTISSEPKAIQAEVQNQPNPRSSGKEGRGAIAVCARAAETSQLTPWLTRAVETKSRRSTEAPLARTRIGNVMHAGPFPFISKFNLLDCKTHSSYLFQSLPRVSDEATTAGG